MQHTIEHIRTLHPLSDETVCQLLDSVTPTFFPRRTLMVRAGLRCGHAFFVEKGMTRSYWVVDDEEVTTSFAGEGCIVFSMDELYYNKESEEYVEALEDVEAYQIAIPTLLHLFETNLELCNWGRIIHQNEYRR
ncbi:MAG: cyclic nucleotide-binding domain-containing protein, partial [Bacteroidaceae bacterium]|nr:cyclic nucleotide-binding domain-containing protein [Bacteroidaceae bacterium]